MSIPIFNLFYIYAPTAFIPVEELKVFRRYMVVLASNVVFNANNFRNANIYLFDTSTVLGYSPVEPSIWVATSRSGRTLACDLLSHIG